MMSQRQASEATDLLDTVIQALIGIVLTLAHDLATAYACVRVYLMLIAQRCWLLYAAAWKGNVCLRA